MYKYKKIEGAGHPLFLFRTLTGSEYKVSFTNYDVLENIQIQMISVDCENSRVKDILTGETINDLIQNYLSENPNVILAYVCDSEDERAAHRQRKFLGWYQLYAKESRYSLRAYHVPVIELDLTYYTALIYDAEVYSSEFMDKFYKTQIKNYVEK